MEPNENLSKQNAPQINNSVFSYYGFAWGRLWKYFLELLLVTIVSFLITLPTIGLWDKEADFPFEHSVSIDLIFFGFEGPAAYLMFALAFVLLFEWPLEYGISFVHLKAARNEKVEVKDMFTVFQNYWNAVFANMLIAVIIGFGLMLLVIPGIIFACKLAFVPYLVVDKKMEAVEAVKASWKMTNGYSMSIFLTGFSAFFVCIFGLIAFVVGIVIAIIWIRLTFASIYLSASQQSE